jgi:hypothetical protein
MCLVGKTSHIIWDDLHCLSDDTKQSAFPVRCRFYLYVECDVQGLKILL